MDTATFSLSMLRSAVAVLSEAARQAQERSALDAFYQSEIPLALEDAERAIEALEREVIVRPAA
ncbi:MAG: hypothetical protein AAF253_13800 [Pseudomonadota bacterium]